MRIGRGLLGLGLVVGATGACGGGGSHHQATVSRVEPRTVDVDMRDIAYSPTTVSVQAGEVVTFVFHNQGQITHDAFLGDEAAQAEHEKAMRADSGGRMGGMGGMGGGDHGDADGVKVDPGQAGALTHTFQRGESLVIGCHEPGHYQAGMKLTVTVS